MEKLSKRLLFLIGVIPVFLASIIWWIFTGKHPIENVIDFQSFCEV